MSDYRYCKSCGEHRPVYELEEICTGCIYWLVGKWLFEQILTQQEIEQILQDKHSPANPHFEPGDYREIIYNRVEEFLKKWPDKNYQIGHVTFGYILSTLRNRIIRYIIHKKEEIYERERS